jgi:hypothetical protein
MQALRTVAATTAFVALFAAACGGGATSTPVPSATAPSTVTASASEAASAVAPTELTGDDKTALALGGRVGMRDYRDHDGRYTIKVPVGWTAQEGQNAYSATLGSTTTGVPASAQVGVYCLPNSTVDQLIASDLNILQQAGVGGFGLTDERPAQVASLPAREVRWSGDFRGLHLDHVSVYFEGHGCAWRILLTIYPGASIDALRPVLDTMLETFSFIGA